LISENKPARDANQKSDEVTLTFYRQSKKSLARFLPSALSWYRGDADKARF
jgi:hypothetical protein